MATEVDKLLVRIQADVSDLKRGLDRAQRQTNTATQGMAASFSKVRGAVAVLGSALAGLGLGVLATNSVRATAEMEDLERSMASVFGGIENGRSAVKFIQDFATKTPFDIQTLSKSFIQLGGAGIRPTEKLLTTLGNAASVTTNKMQSFESLTRIITRGIRGGLGLEELEQLVTAGIDVYGILQEELGKTRNEISEFGKTAEGAQQIIDALLRGLDTRFPDAMAQASNNLSTNLSNLGIAANNALIEIGEGGLKTAVIEVTQSLSAFLQGNRRVLRSIGASFASAIRGAAAAVKFLADNMQFLTGIATILAGGLVLRLIPSVVLLAKSMSTLGAVITRNPILFLSSLLITASLAFDEVRESVENVGKAVQEYLGDAFPDNPFGDAVADFRELELTQESLAEALKKGADQATDFGDQIKKIGDEAAVVKAQLLGMDQGLSEFLSSQGVDPTKYIDSSGAMTFNTATDAEAANVQQLVQQYMNLQGQKLKAQRIMDGKAYAQEKNAVDQLKETLNSVEQAYANGFIGAVEFRKAQAKLTREIESAKGPLGEYKNELHDINLAYENVAVDGLRAMEDTLIDVINGTRSAKEAFRDMAANIVRDLQRIQIRKSITEPLSEMLTNFTRGGSISTNIMQMLGFGGNGGGGSIFSTIGKSIGGFLGFAGGGSVQSGQPIMVGERGPEMFVPHSAGAIQPRLNMAGSGKPPVNIYQTFQITGGAQQVARQEILAAAPQIREETIAAVREIGLRG